MTARSVRYRYRNMSLISYETNTREVPVYAVSIPEYRLAEKPDYQAVGRKINETIFSHFPGEGTAIRCLSVADHPNQTLNSLIETIQRLGTDRYDSNREGVLHDFYKGRGIDLFALPYNKANGAEIMAETIENFYEGALQDRGYRVKLDVILIYDLNQLEFVPVDYGNGDMGRDAFRFKDPANKAKALLGIIKIV